MQVLLVHRLHPRLSGLDNRLHRRAEPERRAESRVKLSFRIANAGSPVQCTGAIHSTFQSSRNAPAIRLISSGFAGSRWVPPKTKCIGLSIVALAVSTIFSIVG
jgi:hypothetical protein